MQPQMPPSVGAERCEMDWGGPPRYGRKAPRNLPGHVPLAGVCPPNRGESSAAPGTEGADRDAGEYDTDITHATPRVVGTLPRGFVAAKISPRETTQGGSLVKDREDAARVHGTACRGSLCSGARWQEHEASALMADMFALRLGHWSARAAKRCDGTAEILLFAPWRTTRRSDRMETSRMRSIEALRLVVCGQRASRAMGVAEHSQDAGSLGGTTDAPPRRVPKVPDSGCWGDCSPPFRRWVRHVRDRSD